MQNGFKRRNFMLIVYGAFVTLGSGFLRKGFAQTSTPSPGIPVKTGNVRQVLVSEIATAPSSRLSAQDAARRSQSLAASADQIDEALDALEGNLVQLTVPTAPTDSAVAGGDEAAARPTLAVNAQAVASLNAQEKQAANNLVNGFQTAVAAGDLTSAALRQDEQSAEIPLQTKQGCSNGRVCWKFKWWGVRIRINHCGVEALSSGGRLVGSVPGPVTTAIGFFTSVLRAFDKGCGVQIHWLWINVSYIKSKSCSKCN